MKFVGSVQVSDDLILHDVLFVPSFSFNLIFLSSLIAQMPVMIRFVGDFCVLQDRFSSKMIGKTNKWNGLYLLEVTTPSVGNTQVVCNSITKPSFLLGMIVWVILHINIYLLKHLMHIDSLPVSCFDKHLVCPLAKQ